MGNMTFDTKIKLNNGVEMPLVGYSTEIVGRMAFHDQTRKEIIAEAIEAGYRRFEIVESDDCQRALGDAIRESGIPREEFFLSCKPQIADIRDFRYYHAFEEILAQLQMDFVDLYSVYWPQEKVFYGYPEEWQRKAWVRFQDIYKEGRVRAIGLCHFQIPHIEKILNDPDTKIMPAVNQDQFLPLYSNKKVRQYCSEKGIIFGALNEEDETRILKKPKYREFENPGLRPSGFYEKSTMLKEIGESVGKSIPQVINRWILQHGALLNIKAVGREQMEEEKDIFDFILSEADMAKIDAVNLDFRVGYDPEHIDF